jgi:hypothetical protein
MRDTTGLSLTRTWPPTDRKEEDLSGGNIGVSVCVPLHTTRGLEKEDKKYIIHRNHKEEYKKNSAKEKGANM